MRRDPVRGARADQPTETPPCACPYCVACCHRKPGMLKPGEAEGIAAHLGLSLEETFRTKLAVDVVHDSDRDTYTLAPASKDVGNAGGMYRDGEGGTCVFLAEGRCSIHAVKPWECRITDHTRRYTRMQESAWARPWRRHKRMLEWLLGRKLPQRAVTGLPEWSEPRVK